MKLMVVKRGFGLHWPEGYADPKGPVRGLEGYVVDFDAPCEATLCAGQTHKLGPAPEGAKPTEIVNRRARDEIKKALAAQNQPEHANPKRDALNALPGIDEIPTKRGREKAAH